MAQLNNPEDLDGARRKVLFITGEPLWSLISPFLVRMGCSCSRVGSGDLDVILEKEIFDAVLLDADHSQIPVEHALLRIQEIRPGLSGRTLVIRRNLAEPQTIDVVDPHDLQHVSGKKQIEDLWAALQNIFPSSHSADLALLSTPAAQMVLDSSGSSMPAGVRGGANHARQVVFQHESATIDLLIEPREWPGGLSIKGQVLDRSRKSENSRVLVLLVTGRRNRAQTSTNQFGEFSLTCESVEPTEDAHVEVRLGRNKWISLPVGKIEEEKEVVAELDRAS